MERKIQLSSEIDRTELFGNLDVNLDLIQEAAGVEIIQRDDRLILKGDSDDALDMAEGFAQRTEQHSQKTEEKLRQAEGFSMSSASAGRAFPTAKAR